MLLGLALIAGPLLVAVVDAAIQIRSLARTSQQLVLEGVQSARLTRSLSADIASLERTVRLYQVLKEPKMLDSYRRTDQSLAATRSQLAALLTEDPTRRSLEDFAHAVAVAITDVRHRRFATGTQVVEGIQMRGGEVVDVDVVTYAGAVGRGEVGAEYRQEGALAHCRFAGNLDQ